MLKQILSKLIKPGVSDIHIKANEPVHVRQHSNLAAVSNHTMTTDEVEKLLQSFLTDKQKETLKETGNMDCAINVDGIGRLRINIYRQKGTYALAIRIIPSTVHRFEDLHLPVKTMETLCRSSRGLIIISGVTGAGKTTTLNSMIDYMNENFTYNIITIEDPIEFTHASKKSSLSQREIGRDVQSFGEGLRFVLRQDPDVIVLGEMRDQDTFRAAMEGAASGHLVIATLHSNDTIDAVDRIVNSFDVPHQAYVRLQFTNALRAILSLRLAKEKYDKGVYPATEVLFGTLQIRNLLSTGQNKEAKGLIEQGSAYNMHSFDQDLVRMVEEGMITSQEALNNSSQPNDLRLKLQTQAGGNVFDLMK